MAVALRAHGPAGDPEGLRALVAEQHRRLRVYQAEIERPGETADVVESFPSRCAKPILPTAALARLIAEAEARLALQDSGLGQALRAPWPERLPEIPVLRPSPGLPAYAQAAEGPTPNIVFALFGRDAGERRRGIETVLREQRGAQPFVPIFLTNDPDFGVLREARLVFEYYPFVLDDTAAAAPADWAAYFLDALQLTMRRWGVARIVPV